MVGLLFGEELNKAQELGAQAAARVGDEGHESCNLCKSSQEPACSYYITSWKRISWLNWDRH